MSPSSAIRSFAIILAIGIITTGPGADGFSISRTATLPAIHAPTDLSPDESSQLQVKYDMSISNATKTRKDEDTNKSMTSSNSNEITTVLSTSTATEKTGTAVPTTLKDRSTTEDTKIPTISSDTVEVFDSVELVTEYVKRNDTVETSSKSTVTYLKQNVISLENIHTVTATENFSEIELSTELSTVSDQIATESELTEHNSTKTVAHSVAENDEMTTTLNDITEMTDITIGSMETSITKNDLPIVEDVGTTSTYVTTHFLPILSTISSETLTTPTEVSHSTLAIDTTDIPETKTTESLWTKHTTIVRKRVTSSEDTYQTARTEDDTMKAETSNTRMNFEKTFDVTPAPSKENLRVDLLSAINQSTVNNAVVFEESDNTTVAGEEAFISLNTVESNGAKILETVQTKRAGYLDNSEKASTPLENSQNSSRNENITETKKHVADIEPTETEGPNFKKVSGSESQSQLAEDAIQEEFLKEEALENHQNVNRYRDEKSENNESLKEAASPSVTSPLSVEDSLSVQPITNERSKTTIYTISPNYKPMKKIDVQPSKPFVRDPDDNSWRNESISSLGIVFKPKNSSKSFKEVLKNKTQTEFNNIQEKDTKNQLPDLRVRLEKIAEVRKTKKKKMNKDGEEVYADYEESNSAENSKIDSNSTALSSGEIANVITPFNFKLDLELTTPMSRTSEELKDKNAKTSTQTLFRGPGMDALTTKTPKKFFNIAEYYDTTDEYDADYVTMSKLDLKKFTPLFPPRTTQTPSTHPMEPMLTRPMQPHFPERKPTVQYFPPRSSQKDNVNTFDADFERKFKLFTFKSHPKVQPVQTFVTVPPMHIETDKPEIVVRPKIRPTVKPADLTMYTPVDMSRNYYLTNAPPTTETLGAFLINDETLDRGSYVIKHYKDFLHAAGKDNDDERAPDSDFMSVYTQTEPPRVTASYIEMEKTTRGKDEIYEDDDHFHREVLDRFVDNFNQNSERFKVDFPILYNNSIVHRKVDESGRVVASSRVFLKRLYNNDGTATKANGLLKKPCDPNCDMTVELSPAYELHYYVPEQEEREEREEREEPHGATLAPHRYGL